MGSACVQPSGRAGMCADWGGAAVTVRQAGPSLLCRLPYVGPRVRGCACDGPTSGTLHSSRRHIAVANCHRPLRPAFGELPDSVFHCRGFLLCMVTRCSTFK